MEQKFNSILGNNIRKLRRFYKISAERLGKACGVEKDTIYRWERAECVPPSFVINRIVGIFNIPEDVLLKKNIIIETQESYEAQLKKRSELINDSVLIKEIININTKEDFDSFVDKLETLELPNDTEYEYYNAAYWWFYGEECEAYITE